MLKSKLRKKILKAREKSNQKNIQINFSQIIKILKKEKINKRNIGGYYPVNFEIDDLVLLKKFEKNKFNISLPVIKKNFQMNFYKWSFSEPLKINKYGIPEPVIKNIVYPDILLITAVQIMDEYFETKKKVEQKKIELKDLSNKFRELKSLVYDYRDTKEEEMKQLAQEHEDFKNEIEKNKDEYEKIIEEATDEIESFVEKANLENPVQ